MDIGYFLYLNLLIIIISVDEASILQKFDHAHRRVSDLTALESVSKLKLYLTTLLGEYLLCLFLFSLFVDELLSAMRRKLSTITTVNFYN